MVTLVLEIGNTLSFSLAGNVELDSAACALAGEDMRGRRNNVPSVAVTQAIPKTSSLPRTLIAA